MKTMREKRRLLLLVIAYSGAISLREAREASRTTGESSVSDKTSPCTTSEGEEGKMGGKDVRR